MAKNPYREDYRLTEHFDEKGRVHTTSEYIGKKYRFFEDAAVISFEKKKEALLAAAGWLCFLAALWQENAAMHHLYIALPFAFTALPLALYTHTAAVFCGMKEPLEHRHAERMNHSFPPAALAVMLFSLFSLAGELLGYITEKEQFSTTGDLFFTAGAFGLFLVGVFAFKARKKVTIVPEG